MAQNLTPAHWLEGYTATGSAITIPLAALPGLDAAEAAADSGDIRKVMRALLTAIHEAWTAEAAADRPAKWIQTRTSSINNNNNQVTRVFTNTFVTQSTGEEVADEEE